MHLALVLLAWVGAAVASRASHHGLSGVRASAACRRKHPRINIAQSLTCMVDPYASAFLGRRSGKHLPELAAANPTRVIHDRIDGAATLEVRRRRELR